MLVAALASTTHWMDHVELLVPACEQHGVMLLAPALAIAPSLAAGAPFQQLGRGGQRADLFLHQCLREVGFLADAEVGSFHLLGHSGGAQFAHRYLMAHPQRVERAVIAAAGWYTFPDTAQRFPHGIRPTRRLPGLAFNPEAYLRVPTTVIVGGEDTQVARLRSNERIELQQGANRLERARRWVAAMRAQAQAHGMPPLVELIEVPGAGHGFKQLCARGNILEHAIGAAGRRLEH